MHGRCHLQDGGQQPQLARYDQNANKKICQQGPLASSFSSNNSKTESQLLPLLCVFSITVSWHWRLHVRVRVITRQLQSRKNIIIIYKILKFYDFFTLKKCVTILIFFFRSNIVKLWTKFSNKLSCKLRLQLHSIFFYWI